MGEGYGNEWMGEVITFQEELRNTISTGSMCLEPKPKRDLKEASG